MTCGAAPYRKGRVNSKRVSPDARPAPPNRTTRVRAQSELDAIDGDTILQAFVTEYDRLKAVVDYHEGGDVRALGGF